MRAGIIGATGYTGFELVKAVTRHKFFNLTLITSESYAGKKISEVYPALKGICDMTLSDNDMESASEKADMFFLCLPHKASMKTAEYLYGKGKIVLDLSADFRINDKALYESVYGTEHTAPALLEKAVYGHAEIFTQAIKKTNLVAVPGCYPTSIITPLYPLIENALIDTSFIIADSKSGVSGAGRKPSMTNSFCEVNEDFKPYGIFTHRHNAEIDHILSRAKEPCHAVFTPHLLPVNRGILSTIYTKSSSDIELIKKTLASYYKDRRLVRLHEDAPCLKWTVNTSFIDIAAYKRDDNLIIVSVIDNLLKGASGQALQCANIIAGHNETEGLL
ncbi:MAG: N-acetyl-gamma-glutamyl-phosphate reductase [Mucispirillum sp.]|nr:N-acetyl-gamma-glutamyl-phosphate reductase [Mucispirillum sp.]